MKIKFNFKALTYIMAYVVFMLLRVVNNSLLQNLISENFTFITHWFVLLLLVVSYALSRKINRTFFIQTLSLGMLSLIIYLFSRNVDFLCIVFFMICAININENLIIKSSLITNTVLIMIVFYLCNLGIIEDLTYKHSSFLGISMAHSYGFVYYSNAPFMLLFMSLMLIYFYNNVKTYILVIAVNTIAYIKFTAFLPFMAFILSMILLFILRRQATIDATKRLVISLPILLAGLSIGLSLMYSENSKIMRLADTIVNTRISQGHRGLFEYGIKPFGQVIEMFGSYKMTYGGAWESHSNFFIDNDYLFVLLVYGFLFFALLLYLYYKQIRFFINNNQRVLLVWTITSLVFALINSTLISIDFNPILLVGISMMYKNMKRNRIFKNDIYNV